MTNVRGTVVALVLAGALAVFATPAADALTFQSYPYEVRDLSLGARQYSVSAVLPRVDPGVHDRYGVRMRPARGVLYDFPRGQSTYGLLNLSRLAGHRRPVLPRPRAGPGDAAA